MSDDEIEDFGTGDVGSGASDTYPMQCSALRKGGHVVINGRPCKISDMSTSKTGKHGHAKVHLVAIDIFTSKKMEDLCPSTHNMNVPNVTRKDYQLMGVDDGFMSLMDPDTNETREDLKVPSHDDSLLKVIMDNAETGEISVTILKAMGEEMAVATKSIS